MTRNMLSLIEDAKAAGYVVTQDETTTLITKRVGRWNQVYGIVLFGDETAILADVQLDVAKGMRSYRDMRKALGI